MQRSPEELIRRTREAVKDISLQDLLCDYVDSMRQREGSGGPQPRDRWVVVGGQVSMGQTAQEKAAKQTGGQTDSQAQTAPMKGDKGDPGPRGPAGKDGADGKDGVDATAPAGGVAGQFLEGPGTWSEITMAKVNGLVAALAGKEPLVTTGTTSQYYRGDKTWQTLSTSVVPEGSNLYYSDARVDARISAQKGVASGIAPLDSTSKIPTSYLPALAIVDTFVVSSQSAMLALSAQQGDVAIRTDLSQTFILTNNSPSLLASWQQVLTPAEVSSVGLSMPSEFSVSNSPVTSTGTLTASWSSQTANKVFAAPVAGGVPSFRLLTASDIPDLSAVYQPLDSDLTAIAALSTQAFGRSLLTTIDAAAARTLLGTQVAGSYEPYIAAGSTSQYWRGDKSWQTLNAASVGLGNVLNVAQEPALGNPGTSGFLLSSTTAGVRSWVAPYSHPATHPQSVVDSASGWITTSLTGKQPLDADLTAISALATIGFVRRTAADTWAASTMVWADISGAISYGTTAGTVCQGNDSRLSDARTPTAHALDGALHTISGKTAGQVLLATAATTFGFATISGDATLSGAGALTLSSTITAGGPIGSASVVPVITYDAKGRLTAVSTATITPAAIGAQVAGSYQPLNGNLTALSSGQTNAPVIMNGVVVAGNYFADSQIGDTILRWGAPYTEKVRLGVMSDVQGSNASSLWFSASAAGSNYSFTAASFIKTGGMPSQFLKADGSVDSTSYATAASLGSYLPLSGGTMAGKLTLAPASAGYASLNIPAQTVAPTASATGDVWNDGAGLSVKGLGLTLTRGASDSLVAGSFLTLQDALTPTKGWIAQLGASNTLDLWNYSTSWTRRIQFFQDGSASFSGSITGSSFVKSGGMPSQFLKADGSVDSTSYATAASLGSYLPLSGGTMSGKLTIAPAAAGYASLNIPTRSATVTTPANGDVQNTGNEFHMHGVGVVSVLAANDTVGAGSHLGVFDQQATTKAWLFQLGASNDLAFWNFASSTWTKRIQFFQDGSASFAGASISSALIGQWNTAYSWGNHASAGYASASSLANYLPLSGGTLTGWLSINGSARKAWGSSLAKMTHLGGTSCIGEGNFGNGSYLFASVNWYYDGTNNKAIETRIGAGFPASLSITDTGSISLFTSTTNPTADSILSDFTSKWSVDRFGNQTNSGSLTVIGTLTRGGYTVWDAGNLAFAGTGSASTMARSDHNHSGTYQTVGNYVTTDTDQTITGLKTFDHTNTFSYRTIIKGDGYNSFADNGPGNGWLEFKSTNVGATAIRLGLEGQLDIWQNVDTTPVRSIRFRSGGSPFFLGLTTLGASTASAASIGFTDGTTPTAPAAGDAWRSNGRISFQIPGIHVSNGRSDTLRSGAFLELANGQDGNGVVLQAGTTNTLDIWKSNMAGGSSLVAGVDADGGGFFTGNTYLKTGIRGLYAEFTALSFTLSTSVLVNIYTGSASGFTCTVGNGSYDGQVLIISCRSTVSGSISGTNLAPDTTRQLTGTVVMVWKSSTSKWI